MTATEGNEPDISKACKWMPAETSALIRISTMHAEIRPIRRAVVVLDQASGELHGGQRPELDLWDDTRRAICSGVEIILAVPTELAARSVTQLSDKLDGLTVVPISQVLRPAQSTRSAGGRAGEEPPTAFFAADRSLRGEAARANLQPAPHIALLPMMQRGELPQAARLVGSKRMLSCLSLQQDVVPLHFQPQAADQWVLIALVSGSVRAVAVQKGVSVTTLSYDAMTHDLLLVRLAEASAAARTALAGHNIIYAEGGQVLLSLGPDDPAAAVTIPGCHGSAELLPPDPNLTRAAAFDSVLNVDSAALSQHRTIFERVQRQGTHILQRPPEGSLVMAHYAADLARYTGVAPLDSQGAIVSRHVAHPDNKRAESALLADLERLGYYPRCHEFTHAGRTHSNIIADLPGAGIFRIKPAVFERYGEILSNRKRRNPGGTMPPERGSRRRLSSYGFIDVRDVELCRSVEGALRLRPWYPFESRRCPLPGFGAQLVIVGCRLDSAGGFEPGATASASGLDGHGAGLAAMLSLARYFRSLSGQLTHTVRFCFFNAEAVGVVGSKAYAAQLKAFKAPVRAVLWLDPIGKSSDDERLFEVHAGDTQPASCEKHLPPANDAANGSAVCSKLDPEQSCAGPRWHGSPLPGGLNGATARSDHTAFRQQGYPAVLAGEDLLANLAAEPPADRSPSHAGHTTVDRGSAPSLVCAVAREVVQLAR